MIGADIDPVTAIIALLLAIVFMLPARPVRPEP